MPQAAQARITDTPEVAEMYRDYHEGIRIATGSSFKQAERRHLIAMKKQIDFLKDQVIKNQTEISKLKTRIHQA